MAPVVRECLISYDRYSIWFHITRVSTALCCTVHTATHECPLCFVVLCTRPHTSVRCVLLYCAHGHTRVSAVLCCTVHTATHECPLCYVALCTRPHTSVHCVMLYCAHGHTRVSTVFCCALCTRPHTSVSRRWKQVTNIYYIFVITTRTSGLKGGHFCSQDWLRLAKYTAYMDTSLRPHKTVGCKCPSMLNFNNRIVKPPLELCMD